MKRLRIAAIAVAGGFFCLLMTGCTRTIRSPADELAVNRWGAVCENGNVLELSFDDDDACFTAKNDAFSLTICGVYTADDTTLMIHDSATHLDYHFGYQLHGDGIELTYGGATLKLDKK